MNLAVPVLSAVGGAGRSTTAGLLAAGLSACAPTALIDTGEPSGSPWPSWVDQPGTGLAALPAPEFADPAVIRAAVSVWSAGGGQVPVLCDVRGPDAAPMPRAVGPGVWCQVIVTGGWQVGVLDIGLPASPQLLAAKYLARRPPVLAWLATPGVVPVVCCATSGPGLQATAAVLDLIEQVGLEPARVVLVLVDVAAGRVPGPVTAAVSLLRPRVGGLVRLPHDARIRAAGLAEFHRTSPATQRACQQLAAAVLDRATYRPTYQPPNQPSHQPNPSAQSGPSADGTGGPSPGLAQRAAGGRANRPRPLQNFSGGVTGDGQAASQTGPHG